MDKKYICNNIDEEYKKIILKLVDKYCPNLRKPKYSNEYYLQHIIYVLKDVTSWRALNITYKNNEKPYHYKTIQDKFHEWTNAGIFKKAYDKLLEKYVISDINSSVTLSFFMDGTLINNKNGSELVDYGRNKKKKVTNLAVVSNKKNQVVEVMPFSGNVHDANTVLPMVEKLKEKIKFRKLKIVADKGYILKENKLKELEKNQVIMITPKRKNQKKKTTQYEKNHLIDRYQIEHVMKIKLKVFNRISVRSDKLIKNYMSFLYLALILKFQK